MFYDAAALPIENSRSDGKEFQILGYAAVYEKWLMKNEEGRMQRMKKLVSDCGGRLDAESWHFISNLVIEAVSNNDVNELSVTVIYSTLIRNLILKKLLQPLLNNQITRMA